MAATPSGTTRGRAARTLTSALRGLVAVALVGAAALGVLFVLGHSPQVVRSGSMSPTIGTGDLVLVRRIAADRAAPGDVITFRDPTRQGVLVTHRVVERRNEGAHVTFVTRGDANSASETWSIRPDGTVGRLSVTIRKGGYVLAALGQPGVRVASVSVGGLLLIAGAVRRIWVPPPGVPDSA